jgi:hypothetical protein
MTIPNPKWLDPGPQIILKSDLIAIETAIGTRSIPVGGCYINTTGVDPATERGYGTWLNLGLIGDSLLTSLWLQFEGSDSTITDLSRYEHVITAHGGATQSAADKKFGSKSLALGTTDYLTIPYHPTFTLSGDFTVEMWVNFNSLAADIRMLEVISLSRNIVMWAHAPTNTLCFNANDATGFSVSWIPSAATWYHVAIVRNGNLMRFFADGAKIGSDQNVTGKSFLLTGAESLGIGANSGSLNGYLDELRIINGDWKYWDDFTPPTAPFVSLQMWVRTA